MINYLQHYIIIYSLLGSFATMSDAPKRIVYKNVSCARCNRLLNKCECKRPKRLQKNPTWALKSEAAKSPKKSNHPVLLNSVDGFNEGELCDVLGVPVPDGNINVLKLLLQHQEDQDAAIAAELAASASMPFQCPLSSAGENDIEAFLMSHC